MIIKRIFKAVQGFFAPKPSRAVVMLKNADELATKWHLVMLEFHKERFNGTHDDKHRAAYEYIVANEDNLCQAFMSGYMTAMSNQD